LKNLILKSGTEIFFLHVNPSSEPLFFLLCIFSVTFIGSVAERFVSAPAITSAPTTYSHSFYILKGGFVMFFRKEYWLNSLAWSYSMWIMIFICYFSLTQSQNFIYWLQLRLWPKVSVPCDSSSTMLSIGSEFLPLSKINVIRERCYIIFSTNRHPWVVF
jgi:hypothetical protein